MKAMNVSRHQPYKPIFQKLLRDSEAQSDKYIVKVVGTAKKL